MECRIVLAARLGKTAADRQVNGSADLFVKEHILGELSNTVIGADTPFAQVSRAVVGVQQRYSADPGLYWPFL